MTGDEDQGESHEMRWSLEEQHDCGTDQQHKDDHDDGA